MGKIKNSATHQQAKNEPLVVGLGASAGGLEALKIFFDSLPEKTGMAFIVIVHLSPEHKSSMAGLLQDHTSLKVIQVNETVEIKEDHVYVIPPDKMLSVGDNHLELSELKKMDHKPVVVDHLFRTLGTVKGEHSACISLSGTGSDGCVGLKAVKEHGGLVIAQDPREAKYSGMPDSAIKTGLVEKVLPVGEMAKELMAYKKNMSGDRISDNPDSLSKEKEKEFTKILAQVRSKTEHDFSHYKRTTVLRRIERRMHVNQVDTLAGYLSFLKEHPDEARELFKDLLITVTNFFRDPAAFKAVESKAIPKLFEGKHRDDEVRVWVPGCATGEEAYSIAMLLSEYADSLDEPPQIQIFATDVDEDALNHGRQGMYAESIVADLTEQRLHHFFTKTGNEYQVSNELREMILFARHNLLGSPPFSKQDMISCRNLLIYLDRELQSEVFNLFHYALKQDGLLFLGNADSNLEAAELFTPLDKKHRIYKKSSRTQSKVHLPDIPLRFDKKQFSASNSWKMPSKTKINFDKLHSMLIAREYAPPSVIINENDEVLHATGDIGQYLKYTRGEPSRNIFEMIIAGLRRPLRSMLYRAKKDGNEGPVRNQHAVNLNDGRQLIELNVHKIKEKDFPKDLRYIVFRKMDDAKVKSSAGSDGVMKKAASDGESEIIEELENELNHTKEQLQITAEDYETSNEELRASNEELQSMNEELQSTTEELETSQEELQSVNEELKTVNQELESKIESLSEANNDLKNLMDATEIGIIFMDRESRVKRFTTKATEFFNLTPSDVGRPLEHFTHRFDYDGILDDIKTVRDSSKRIKREVSDEKGRNFDMRLTPYQTTENGIEGVVITFVDITELKNTEKELAQKVEKVKGLQREILKNDVSERWKVGQYLHDEIAQSLVAAEFMLNHLKGELKNEEKDFAEEIDRLIEILKDTVKGSRDLSHEIIPIDVQQEGVIHAFTGLCKQLEKAYGIHCSVEGNSIMDGIGNIEVATHLYRIAHEAAKNAAIHGDAKNVKIALNRDDKFICLNIEDDGKGFSGSKDTDDGMGISIMRHRMELIGGTLEIKDSTDLGNNGVKILCKVPGE